MKTTLKMTVVAFSVALTACGGGGGSTSTTPPVSQTCANGALDYPTCTPGVTPAKLQTSVPTPTYSAASEEVLAFNEINSFRKAVGLGLLAQNVKLDVSAQNHVNYVANTQIIGHDEVASKTGFTGVTAQDRANFAGYNAGVGEVVAGNGAVAAVRSLINSVYHRDILLLQPIVDIGIGTNQTWVKPVVIDFGFGGKQNNASNFVTTYPLNGQANLPLAMNPEAPSPLADVSGNAFGTSTSSPISFYAAYGTTVSVNSFTVTKDGQNSPLPMKLITASNDINKMVDTNTAHLLGSSPFAANTKYNVSFNGTVNGVAVSKTWSFTTGSSLFVGGGV